MAGSGHAIDRVFCHTSGPHDVYPTQVGYLSPCPSLVTILALRAPTEGVGGGCEADVTDDVHVQSA